MLGKDIDFTITNNLEKRDKIIINNKWVDTKPKIINEAAFLMLVFLLIYVLMFYVY